MDESGTSAVASRWPIGLAVFFVLLGAMVSASLALAWTLHPPGGEDPLAEEPPEATLQSNPDNLFLGLQADLAEAKTREQRLAAGLAMAEFLLTADAWRPDRDRFVMARDYLLALAAMDPDGWLRLRVAQHLFVVARDHLDEESLLAAEALLRPESEEGADVPELSFDLLAAEIDSLLLLGDPAIVYQRIDELGERVQTPDESMQHVLRAARGCRLALEHEAAMEAFWAHRGEPVPANARERLMEELAASADSFIAASMTRIETEGLWHKAFLAGLRGEAESEIDTLQELIAKGMSPYRSAAYQRLAQLLREEHRDLEHADLLGRMLILPEQREFAVGELQARLLEPATEEVAQSLFLAVNHYLELEASDPAAPLPALLVAAGQMAIEQNQLSAAERYLDQAETLTLDRKRLSDIMMARAEIARLRDNHTEMIHYYKDVLHFYPGHPQEGDIRFILLQEMAAQPFREADLVGGIIGAITRLPADPRGIRGLLMVAQRLEDQELYDLAETYFRLAVLLGTLQQTRDTDGRTAEALLGQARVMAAQGKWAEADALLRVISTNVRWSDIWNVSGPLWSDLAFRQGQFREGIRRWRHTCGPPGGDLLPYLFETLVPDLGEWSVQLESVTPRKPGRVPPTLVQAAVEAVLEQLLENNDYAGVQELMDRIENDPEWKGKLPLERYRIRTLERMAAQEPAGRTFAWLKEHPVEIHAGGDANLSKLTDWIDYVEAVNERIQSWNP